MIFKSCPCGHDLTLKEWLTLPLVGEMRVPGEPVLQLRNHSPGCDSTIAIELPARPVARARAREEVAP
jgi:hypothetical protein